MSICPGFTNTFLRERFRESRISPGRISVITESCKNSVGEVPVEQENSCLSSCYISSALLCALCPVSAGPEIWSICCNFHLLPLPSQMSIVSIQPGGRGPESDGVLGLARIRVRGNPRD